jgi:hypothetical protein
VGHGTADAELLWQSTTKAGAVSRGLNAGTISGRVFVCASSRDANTPLMTSTTPSRIVEFDTGSAKVASPPGRLTRSRVVIYNHIVIEPIGYG